MVEAGVPSAAALQSATWNASLLLDRNDDLGSLSVGKRADLVAVAGNPVDEIALMKAPVLVMKDGVIALQH